MSGPVINAVWSGSGAPLLLAVHGLGCSLRFWDEPLHLLSSSYRSVAIDLPGFGASPPPPEPCSVPGLAASVSAWLDREQVGRVVVTGHSLGGMVAQELALLEARRGSGRIRGLVLCCTIPGATERVRAINGALAELVERDGTEALVDALMPAMLGPEQLDGTEDAARRFRADVASSSRTALSEALRAIADFDCRPFLPSLAADGMPALVLGGEHETNLDEQQALADLVGAAFVTVAGTGHLAPAESPRRFVNAIEPFLASRRSGETWL